RRHIITTAVEHPAVLNVAKDMERRGWEVDVLDVDEQGRLDLAEGRRQLDAMTDAPVPEDPAPAAETSESPRTITGTAGGVFDPNFLKKVDRFSAWLRAQPNVVFVNSLPTLIKRLNEAGFPVGGTGASVSMISHTQGWLHCDIPGTDASGVVKSLMDVLHAEFIQEKMPNRVRITTSCCQINCGGQGDIAVNEQYTKPPRINHDLVANVCERPAVVARCPVAAIRPAMVNGKPSLEVDERKCVACGACYPPCPPMQINGKEETRIAIWVGGKHSNARSKPTFHKLAVANLPNNPPHWPEVSEIVRRIVQTYKKDAKHWERMGEWIERIGWNRFFDKTGLAFTKHHLDTWTGARKTMNMSAHVHF
ncbi:MAG: dissimilatory-type sulfite reductase subunit beta, partial [Maritimibacter sp.]